MDLLSTFCSTHAQHVWLRVSSGLVFLLWQLDEHRDDNCEHTLHSESIWFEPRAPECVNAGIPERMVKRNSTRGRSTNDQVGFGAKRGDTEWYFEIDGVFLKRCRLQLAYSTPPSKSSEWSLSKWRRIQSQSRVLVSLGSNLVSV